jgi:hypothetical protein
MSIRNYSNTAAQSTLGGSIGATDTSIALANYSGDPTPPFTAALGRGTATEEIVLVTAVIGSTVTVVRGYDGTSAQSQSAGTTFQEVVIAADFREANAHVNATSGVHGLTGALVGVTDAQTLTNKTLTAPTMSNPTSTGTSTLATANITTLTVSGVSNLASLNVSGAATLSGTTTAAVLRVSGAPSVAADAARKDYVDTSIANTGVAVSTANTLVRRDGTGGAEFSKVTVDNAPAAASDATRKDYVDAANQAGMLEGVGTQPVNTNSNTVITLGFAYYATGSLAADTSAGKFTAGVAGKYVAVGMVAFPTTNSTGRRVAFLYKNGAQASNSIKQELAHAPALGVAQYVPTQTIGFDLAAGDTIQLGAYQDSTATVNVDRTQSFLNVFRVA